MFETTYRIRPDIFRDHKCDQCPASFTLHRCLKTHIKRKHPLQRLKIRMMDHNFEVTGGLLPHGKGLETRTEPASPLNTADSQLTASNSHSPIVSPQLVEMPKSSDGSFIIDESSDSGQFKSLFDDFNIYH